MLRLLSKLVYELLLSKSKVFSTMMVSIALHYMVNKQIPTRLQQRINNNLGLLNFDTKIIQVKTKQPWKR